MRRPGGYAVLTDPDSGVREWDTFTCSHCNRVVQIREGCDPSEAGGFCRVCMKHVCGPCADKGTCTPFEKRLDQMEARDRFRRSLGLLG